MHKPTNPSSIEDRLAALESHNVELWKENKFLQSRIRTLEVRLATAEDTLINLSKENLGMQRHKSFAFFTRLPFKLRRMIWTFARPAPRVLKLLQKIDGINHVVYSTAKVPALLHACQDSRRVAKEWYELNFPLIPSIHHSPRVYFDYSSDFVYSLQVGQENSNPFMICVMSRGKVMNVIYEVSGIWESFSLLPWCFPSATNALLVREGQGMLRGSAELSEFPLTAEPFTWQGTRSLQQAYTDASKKLKERGG